MRNEREKQKERVIRDCLEGRKTEFAASADLGVSIRQIAKLKAKLKKEGTLLHGNCGRKPITTIPDAAVEIILDEFDTYKGKLLNFKHFGEILCEDLDIKISYSALRNLLIKNGRKSPKQHRKTGKKKHPTRERKEFFGELLQIDGTPFDWFGTGKLQCLHVVIDDNRGVVTGLNMAKNECKQGYFECLSQTFMNYGVPKALYGDGMKFLFGDGKKEPTIEEQLAGIPVAQTQFARDMEALNIHLYRAHSPQAKGRVERKNGTFQGRLVAEFHRYGVKNMKQANEFFKWWLPKHNAQFGVNADSGSVFSEVPANVDLDYILSHKETRTLDSGGVFSLNGYKFQALGLRNCKITVVINKRYGLKACFKGKYYDILPICEGKKKIAPSDSVKAIIDKFVAFYTLKNEHSSSA